MNLPVQTIYQLFATQRMWRLKWESLAKKGEKTQLSI
jgi:hypothetical protein